LRQSFIATRKALKRQGALQTMALAGTVWMAVFCFVPIVWMIIAFMDYNYTKPIWSAPFVGLQHFRMFFADPRFFRVLKNTLGISGLKLLIGFPIPIILALLINEVRHLKLKRYIQTITYLPHFISWAIFGGILISWLDYSGLVNKIAMSLGLQSSPVLYNAQPKYFWAIAVITDTWKEMGWNAIIYLAAIAGVDQSLYDSADVDGAGRFRKMWYITVQAIRPTIAVLFILACGGMLAGNFDQIFVMRNAINLPASETLDLFIYSMGLSSGRFSYSTAILLARSVVSLGLLLSANWISRRLTGESML
jgi:putative aldouronate transport system permease protein